MKIKTLSVWSCTGGNVSELSFSLACRIAEESRTLLCELPCLGLPRLGFISEHMDRIRNTETAILTLDREEELSWQLVNESRPGLWVLPASVYAIPDCPATSRVNMETLIAFAGAIEALAEKNGMDKLIFDCQGQLTSPMTFFALKISDQIIIPVEEPADLAYILAALRRLVKIYGYSADQFILAVSGELKPVESLLQSKKKKGSLLSGVRPLPWEIGKLAAALDWSGTARQEEKTADLEISEEGDRQALCRTDLPGGFHDGDRDLENSADPGTEPMEEGDFWRPRAVAGCSVRL